VGGASGHPRARPDVPIETKLHAPGLRAEWVERPELVQYLAGAAARLILVDAPAGFGKTTLVAQWRCSPVEGRPFAWVSLDSGDDDPGRLWRHVVCALQRASAEFHGAGILAALRVPAPEVAGTALPLLVNELATLTDPVVIVLDDYHVITERSCHEQVEFLLMHLPASAQIVLTTRADPPLPLASLRAAGQLAEIRAPELRFTVADAAALVRIVSAAQLSEPDLADLVERSEGWPAGVYLAALSLRGHPSPSAFVRQFTGDNRFIVDFLAEEVFSRQPGEIQQFLTRTSILNRFCAPLCDAVVGSAGAAEIIEVLERENLFLVPLDEIRQWFRYHHLFAQALRSRLARTEPDAVPALHGRAGAWHVESGSTDEAVGHALAAGDSAGAAELIARHWYAYVDGGRAATVRGWIRSLSDDQIAANPLAAHSAAWTAALSGDRESVRRWLPVMEAAPYEGRLPDGIQSLKSSAALLRGVFGFEGLRAMRGSARKAAELETDPASPWYALARAALGFSLYLSGEPGAATAPLEDAVFSEPAIPMVRILAFSALSLVAVELGRLPRAAELADAARDLAIRGGISDAPQGAIACTAVGAARVAQGQLAEARAAFEHALGSRRNWMGISPWPTVETLLRLTPVLVELGERPAAAGLLDEARQVLTALPDGADAYLARLERLERKLTSKLRAVPFAVPLSEREVVVLRLLRGTLSLREIGQELCLSQNTIKTHARAIYRKLGVSTRQEAVVKGRNLNIC
jgi:LuxR family maltose regulon positive regulatory protein